MDVNDKRETITRLCDLFTQLYPEAEFRGGHIAVSDYNLSDSHIAFCLRILRSGKVESQQGFPADTYPTSGLLQECDRATIAFLEFLLTIPEEIRDVYEEDD